MSRTSEPVDDVKRMLSASRSYFHAIITRNVDGVLVLDDAGLVCFVNPAAQSILGKTEEELLGSTFGIPCVPGESIDVEVARSGEPTPRVVELRVAATRWQRRPAFLATIRDVTDRRRSEELAREEIRRRDEFMAMLSHELRNPIAAITCATRFASSRLDPGTEVADALGVVDRQCRLVSRLLDDLLDVSRFSHGRIELRRDTIALREIVDEAVGTTLLARDCTTVASVRIDFPSEPLFVEGDTSRLVQVMVNLVGNALKYTPAEKCVHVTARAESGDVVVEVCDEGCGIPEDSLEAIFDPFVQLGSSVEHGQAGLGMGLSLARLIVERHGGSIRVESDGTDCGSRFVVRLPRVEDPTEGRADESDDEPIASRGRRILLVEDNADLREMTCMVLELSGHEVVPADGGPAALERLAERRFDVALVDIGMPGMDGFEFARRVRRNDEWRSVELVALTGYGMPEDFEKTKRAGFDQHVVKPVDFEELENVLAGPTLPARL